MHTFSIQSCPALHNNLDHGTEKALRLMKERLHVNMIRPHSGEGTPLENLYNICDEIGMLVYFDWSGPGSFPAYDKEWNNCILESAPAFEEFIRDNYSRPSLVMWSFGNEIYEGHQNLYFSKNLDQLYGMVKKLDLQNRPICSSTGRQTLEAMQAGTAERAHRRRRRPPVPRLLLRLLAGEHRTHQTLCAGGEPLFPAPDPES